MKVPYSWLKEHVAVTLEPAELGAQLTMAGLELESLTAAAPTFNGIVVAEVLSTESHPAASKLKICRVNAGGSEPLTVVCGAPNVMPGMKAPLARVDATMPEGKTITAAALRGVMSHGMLCSARELGLSEQGEGLWALPADAPVGADLRAWLGLDDAVLELNLTPNRADCLSILGVAREASTLLNLPLKPLDTASVTASIDERPSISVEEPGRCPRYVGRIIRGVDPSAPTPLWMKERLRRCGQRSLGPLVDVTNYILLEMGQPLHAFDLTRVQGGIRVRCAKPGERLATLDGDTRELQNDMLVIADHEKALALAGIMGGKDSAVGNDTRDILLESAFFTPSAITGRGRRLGLHTESSHRFERGVDPTLQLVAIERATALILSIAGGLAGPVTEVRSDASLPTSPQIRLRRNRIASVLGIPLDDVEVVRILSALGCKVEATADGWQAVPPSHRFDLRLEIDLIEELGRVHGYHRIPDEHAPLKPAVRSRRDGELDPRRIRQILMAQGYSEAITFSFIDPVWEQAFTPDSQALHLANPISADLAVMRSHLWPGLVKAAQHNLNRQQPRVRLFELGLRFQSQQGQLMQQPVIAGLACGPVRPEQWGESSRNTDFFDVKGDVQALAGAARLWGPVEFVPKIHASLHPGQSALITCQGQTLGWIGTLHPRLQRQFDLGVAPVLFELELDALCKGVLPQVEPPSRFPSIRRDIAFTLAEEIPAAEILASVERLAISQLRQALIFDVYRGPKLDAGVKSVALGLILQEKSRTLKDEEVDATVARVVAALAADVNAKLR